MKKKEINMNELTKIGIDIGKARVGTAKAPAGTNVSLPLSTVRVNGDINESVSKTFDELKEYLPAVFYIGLPLNLKGKPTDSTLYAIKWANAFKKKVLEYSTKINGDEETACLQSESDSDRGKECGADHFPGGEKYDKDNSLVGEECGGDHSSSGKKYIEDHSPCDKKYIEGHSLRDEKFRKEEGGHEGTDGDLLDNRCEFFMIDERLTTVSAQRNFDLAGIYGSRNRREKIDQEEARIILETALEYESKNNKNAGIALEKAENKYVSQNKR